MALRSKPPRDTSIIDQARIVAIVPIGDVALRAPDLIRAEQYLTIIWQTIVAIAISIAIAGAFRLANWIMTVDKR